MVFKEKIGEKYVTATTRRANYSNIYFGKMTIWQSEEDYKAGNCEGAITVNDLHLGNDNDSNIFSNHFRTFAKKVIK